MPEHDLRPLLRLPEVIALTGISKAAIYKQMKQGKFPTPKRVGRSALWRRSDVQAWIESE